MDVVARAARRRCGVVGHPVAHSLSPAIHRAAYAQLGLDWSYDAIDVAPGRMASFVAGLGPQWLGLSVTMPHKMDLVQLGSPDELVSLLGVANTWVRTPDGPIVRNTDVTGVEIALRTGELADVRSVAVLGAGATARSALAGAARVGADRAVVVSRSLERSTTTLDLADALGFHTSWLEFGSGVLGADLLVSTVPAPSLAGLAESLVDQVGAVFDLVYDPWPTPLTVAGRDAGLPTLDGLDLLAAQALGQVRLMTGHGVDLDLLKSAAQNGLVARSRL